MVKLQGPALSLSATGSIGDGMTISTWKGRHYLKTKTTPLDPHSDTQVAQRVMMAFLSKAWPTLTTVHQATWSNVTGTEEIPPYNAFLQYNLDRLNLAKGPTKAYPAAQEHQPGRVGKYQPACSPGIHCIYSNLTFAVQGIIWGYFLQSRLPLGDPPDLEHLVWMDFAEALPTENKRTLQRPVGHWQQTARYFSDDGLIGNPYNQISADSFDYS